MIIELESGNTAEVSVHEAQHMARDAYDKAEQLGNHELTTMIRDLFEVLTELADQTPIVWPAITTGRPSTKPITGDDFTDEAWRAAREPDRTDITVCAHLHDETLPRVWSCKGWASVVALLTSPEYEVISLRVAFVTATPAPASADGR